MPKITIPTRKTIVEIKPKIAPSKLSAPKPIVKPSIKLSIPTTAKDIAKIVHEKEEIKNNKIEVEDILLDNEEAAISPYDSLTDKLAKIDMLLTTEGNLPIDRIRTGLEDVMTCIKAAEGSILELEPDSIKLIVQSYIKIADAEIQQIVQGKTKTTRTKSVASKLKMAKELDLNDLGDADF